MVAQTLEPTPWLISVLKALHSENVTERNSMPVGRHYDDGATVWLHGKQLLSHGLFVGDSDSGKTSVGMLPLAVYLILRQARRYHRWLKAHGYPLPRKASILFLDMKGSVWNLAAFHTLRMFCLEAGIRFKFLTTIQGLASYLFLPMSAENLRGKTHNQIVQTIGRACGFLYATDEYARGAFGSDNEQQWGLLYATHGAETFREMYGLFREPAKLRQAGINPHGLRDLSHPRAVMARLSRTMILNLKPEDLPDRAPVFANAVTGPSLLREPQVVYALLPFGLEEATNRSTGRLLMELAANACLHRGPGEDGRLFILADEFPAIAGSATNYLTEMLRSAGCSVFVSCQHFQQLKLPYGVDVASTVKGASYHRYFRTNDPDTLKYIQLMGGMGKYADLSWSQSLIGPWGDYLDPNADGVFRPELSDMESVNAKEREGPLIEWNKLLDVNADRRASFLWCKTPEGFNQSRGRMIPVRSDYVNSAADFRDLETLSWPLVDENTVMVEDLPFPSFPVSGRRHEPQPHQPDRRARQHTGGRSMRELLEEERRRVEEDEADFDA